MFEKYQIKSLAIFYFPMILLQGLVSTVFVYAMVNSYYDNGFRFIDVPSLIFYPSIIYILCFIIMFFTYVLYRSRELKDIELINTNILIQSILIIILTILISFMYDYLYFFFIDNSINNAIADLAIENIDRITSQNQQQQIDEFNGFRNQPFFIFCFPFYSIALCVITPIISLIGRNLVQKINNKNQHNF